MHVWEIFFRCITLIFSHKMFINNNNNKKMTLLDDDVDEKIPPYINVTGIVTNFDTEDHSFNMCPTQYTALAHTSSPLPLHGYFTQ
jgi:hypothetical protein